MFSASFRSESFAGPINQASSISSSSEAHGLIRLSSQPAGWALDAPPSFKNTLTTARALRKARRLQTSDELVRLFPSTHDKRSDNTKEGSLPTSLSHDHQNVSFDPCWTSFKHSSSSTSSQSFVVQRLSAFVRAHRSSVIPAMVVFALFGTLVLVSTLILSTLATTPTRSFPSDASSTFNISALESLRFAYPRFIPEDVSPESAQLSVVAPDASAASSNDNNAWRSARGAAVSSVVYPTEQRDDGDDAQMEERSSSSSTTSSAAAAAARPPSGHMSAKFRALEMYGIGVVRVPVVVEERSVPSELDDASWDSDPVMETVHSSVMSGDHDEQSERLPKSPYERDTGYEHGEDLSRVFGSRIARLA